MAESNKTVCIDPHSQDVVERLEALLLRARAGEISGLFYGYWEVKGGNTITGIAGKGDGADVLWALECFKQDLFNTFTAGKTERVEPKGLEEEPEG